MLPDTGRSVALPDTVAGEAEPPVDATKQFSTWEFIQVVRTGRCVIDCRSLEVMLSSDGATEINADVEDNDCDDDDDDDDDDGDDKDDDADLSVFCLGGV